MVGGMPAVPLVWRAACCQQLDIFYGLAKRDSATDLEDARHGLGLASAIVREGGDGAHIVGEQCPLTPGRPFKHSRIVGPGQAQVLDADDVHTPGLADEDPERWCC